MNSQEDLIQTIKGLEWIFGEDFTGYWRGPDFLLTIRNEASYVEGIITLSDVGFTSGYIFECVIVTRRAKGLKNAQVLKREMDHVVWLIERAETLIEGKSWTELDARRVANTLGIKRR
jgi:hypothetical protein